MISVLFFTLQFILYVYSAPSINTTSIDQGLISEFTFAYEIVSEVKIELPVVNSTLNILPRYEVTWNDTNQFIFPVTSYPFVLVYNIPQLNSSLVLTKELLQIIATNSSFRWNDPSLVELNPGLSAIGSSTRLILNRQTNEINGKLISFAFDNNTDFGDSWVGIASPNHALADGWDSVYSALTILTNTATFLPLPMVIRILSKNVRIGGFLENGVFSNYSLSVPTTTTKTGKWLTVEQDTTWPITVVEYGIYEEQEQKNCDDSLHIMRFWYWVFGNERLYQTNTDGGFILFGSEINKEIQDHLRTATCDSDLLLTFENLSASTRTNAVFSITLVVTILLIFVVFMNWKFTKNRFAKEPILIHMIVILGLILSFISYVIWWYPSSVTWRCTTRMWLLNLGYANILASPTLHMILMGLVGKKANSGKLGGKVSKKSLIFVYPVMMILEILILILWNSLDNPHSSENIVSELEWQINYTCATKSNVWQTIQFIYYCLIPMIGCYIIYANWNIKGSNEANRWMMASLYNQIFVFAQLLIILSILTLTDESLYVILVPFYLFAQLSVVCSFFIPKLFAKYKDRKDFSKTESASPHSASRIELSKTKSMEHNDV